jgi:hypothetical protein
VQANADIAILRGEVYDLLHDEGQVDMNSARQIRERTSNKYREALGEP